MLPKNDLDASSLDKPQDPSRVKSAMQEALRLTRKLGAGAVELFNKLRQDKSLPDMLQTIEHAVSINQERRKGLAAGLEQQFTEIAAKTKVYRAAPPARKRILEAELQTLLAAYKAGERELTVLLENERTLSQVKGRIMEVTAYGLAGVQEDAIDNLIEDVNEKVDEAEGRAAAARDLERAGRRRERESDREFFEDELDKFQGAEPPALNAELAGFEKSTPESNSQQTQGDRARRRASCRKGDMADEQPV